ncbi:MAG TPA: type II secretion system inner membrane protein GspF [Xanthomonadaceae bacterium]|nr:type II secretion system inner membrane protein GspF [Xanthomonadaceae bacterium]
MPAFEYQALTAAGRTERGVLQADTARAARALLRERGLAPLQVGAVDERSGVATFGRGGLSSNQLALLTRQLATLVGAGLPIDEALAALAEGSEGRLRREVVALRARVMEGTSLAQAMAEFPRTFPSMFCATVAAGESAGRLETVLRRLADYAERRDELRRRVIAALTYPALLSLVAVAVVVALMVYVVPQVIEVFVRFDTELPLATRLLIGASELVREHGLWLLGALALLVLAAAWLRREARMRAHWHRWLLALPVAGRLLRALDSARFARTLALLTASAVPLLEALSIAAQVVQRIPLREALARVAVRVREGSSLSAALAETRQFPPVVVRLTASGERAGRLDAMLLEAADYTERELETALSVATAVLGPGVIVVVGGMVLFIVLAILLPIFGLNTLIR